MFVPLHFCIILKCSLSCRVPQETWHLQLWLVSFLNFSTQETLCLQVFFQKFSPRKFLNLLSAFQQQPWVLIFSLISYWHYFSQLRAAIEEYTITGIQQDWPFEYNTYSKVFTQFLGMQAKIDGNSKHATMTWSLRIHWATTGQWVKSIHSQYISWFILQCIIYGWWQNNHGQGGFWRYSGLRLDLSCWSVNFPVTVIVSFFDTRSCEMLCIVLCLCAVWGLSAVNECNMHSQHCQGSCYTLLGRK